MTTNQTIRLLILNDSRTEAERLISMLNNAGKPSRPQHIESEDALVKLLQDQVWDLLIGLDSTENIPPSTAIKHIRRLAKDVPVILLTDQDGSRPLVDGMKMGAVDVVKLDEDQHLLQVITRELRNREDRSQKRLADRRYKEIERRNQQLLDSSRDAIAFVQDGMFLYTNDSFADLLGYTDRDDLECMPVIDTVADEDQERVKQFLKDFMIRAGDIESNELSFKAVADDGSNKALEIEVRKAQYDDEMCLQLFSKGSKSAASSNTAAGSSKNSNTAEMQAQANTMRNRDLATGLFNKNHLIDCLEDLVDAAVAEQITSAMLYISVEGFLDTVQKKVGLASADAVLKSIADFAQTLVDENNTLCRFTEEGFMVLIREIDADSALSEAREIGSKLREKIFEVNDATLQFNFLVGVAIINETTSNSDTPIANVIHALEKARELYQKDPSTIANIYGDEEEAASRSGPSKKEMSKMLQTALDTGKFRLLFQPILSLRGSDKEHYEVLLRMVDNEQSGHSPNEFLDIAAEIGATTKIDRWVILESIKVLSQHRANGNNTRLMINLSKESLKDTTLPAWLGVAFKAAKLPPDAVIFQILESDVNDHLNIAKTFTEQVTALGCNLSISRFGCALNPFTALQHISAQYIKVDGSFTKELQDGTGEPEALNKLVSQIHEHEKITIVPFVENASILSKLWQSGVHYIQGYYLQGPAEQMDYDFDTET